MPADPSPAATTATDADPSLASAWAALLALSRRCRTAAATQVGGYGLDRAGGLRPVPAHSGEAQLLWQADEGWRPAPALPTTTRDLLDLYLPVCAAPASTRPRTYAHLGQSLDGHIATDTGDSCFVTGPENILHLHRMRALCDAVVVGAGTVTADNPRLTTRLVPGDSPLRVVLDPKGRLSDAYGIFTDGAAETLLVCGDSRAKDRPARVGQAEVLTIPAPDGRLDLAVLLARLWKRGIRSVFVEGGGNTVSCFLEANQLDRLQVAVAPLIIGSGRPGVRLPAVLQLHDCLRPAHRIFRMGGDVLFDCDLGSTAAPGPARPAGEGLSRIL